MGRRSSRKAAIFPSSCFPASFLPSSRLPVIRISASLFLLCCFLRAACASVAVLPLVSLFGQRPCHSQSCSRLRDQEAREHSCSSCCGDGAAAALHRESSITYIRFGHPLALSCSCFALSVDSCRKLNIKLIIAIVFEVVCRRDSGRERAKDEGKKR